MSPREARPDAFTIAVRVLAAALILSVWGTVLARDVPAQDEPDRDYWVARYEKLRSEVEELRARVEVLEQRYTQARRRRYPLGDPLMEMYDEFKEAEKELAQKEEEWENFPDEARRAGAYPGWFRD